MSKKVKIFIIAVAVIIVGLWAYSTFGSTPAPAPASPLTSTGTAPAPVSALETKGLSDFSALLSSVRNIDIDTSVFSNPAYKTLRDYPVNLGTDTVGRANPFAPIGSDQDGAIESTPVVQTLQPGKITATGAELGVQITLKDTVPVTVVFEYGTSDTFGTASTPATVAKSGTGLITVNNLIPATTYYVRAVAVRGSTTTTGNTVTFTTTAATAPKR
jgi:hypothetical protein